MYEILVAGIGQIVLLTSARGLRCLRPPATATLLSVGGEGELRTPKSRDALATLQGRLVAATAATHRFCDPESRGRG